MNEEYEEFFKSYTKDLHKRLVGTCKQCGLCCRESWRFKYKCTIGESLTADYNTKEPEFYLLCDYFDTKTNKCKGHGKNKIPLCKYWPLLESDLDQIDCPGYRIGKE